MIVKYDKQTRRDYERYNALMIEAHSFECLLANGLDKLIVGECTYHIDRLLDRPFISVANDAEGVFFIDVEFIDCKLGYKHIRTNTKLINVTFWEKK